jgi:FHS family L-fucose permease-like MFS transporter
MAAQSKPSAALTSQGYLIPFITVTALFFVFGFITNLNMALVPHLRSIFDLPYGLAMLAESAFFLAYFVFSSPTSKLIETIGYKRTMVVSLFVQVAGCLLFVPAAKMVSFPLFLTAVFVVGAGITALQTSANPYVSILGPEHSAPIRLTLAQALNSLGGSLAPLVAGAFILTDPDKIASKASIADTVRGPYIAIAAALLVLGLAVAFSHLPAITETQSFRPGKDGDDLLSRSIWSFKHTVSSCTWASKWAWRPLRSTTSRPRA